MAPAGRAAGRGSTGSSGASSTASAVPGRNDEYLLYQTLVGAWPLELDSADHPALAAFAERIAGYMIKATREAKQRTSWTAPDQDYEAGLERFVRRILDPQEGAAFLADLLPFQPRIARDRRAQRARPDPAEADRAWRARHLPGLRAVGPQRWSIPTIAARSTSRSAPGPADAARRSRRAARQLAGRPHQAARHRAHARAAAPRSPICSRPGATSRSRSGQPERSRGRLRPPERAGIDGRGRAAPGRRPAPGSGAALPAPQPRGATRASRCRPRSLAGRS